MSQMTKQELEELYLNDKIDLSFLDAYPAYMGYVNVDEVIEIFSQLENRGMTLPEVYKEFDKADVFDYEPGYNSDSDRPLMFTIEKFYQAWVDIDAVRNRSDNVLNADASSNDWKVGFHKAVAEMLVKKGQIARLVPSYYGWADYDLILGKSAGKPIAVFNVKEDYWHEFNGTFNTDDDSVTGLTAHVVFDSGYSRDIRAEKTLSEFMKELV